MDGVLEQGDWCLGRVSQGLVGWVLEGAEGLGSGGGWTLRGPDGRTFVCSFVRLDGRTDGRKFPPLFYRTLIPFGSTAQKEEEEDEEEEEEEEEKEKEEEECIC